MVQFNELRISPDGSTMIIDVSIKNEPYYANVYLESIKIDTQSTYINGKASDAIDNPPLGAWTLTLPTGLKTKRIEIPKDTIAHTGMELPDLNTNLLYVYISTYGDPDPVTTPCGANNKVTVSPVLNPYPIYQLMFEYTKELNNTCKVPQNYIDIILRFKAVDVSLKTGNYIQANKYWKKFFMNILPTVSNCGCNG